MFSGLRGGKFPDCRAQHPKEEMEERMSWVCTMQPYPDFLVARELWGGVESGVVGVLVWMRGLP